MTKTLKDILAMQPKTKDYSIKKLEGVNASTIEDGSTGKDPGVDYMPKDGDGQKFVKAHKVEKHAGYNGNSNTFYKNGGDVKFALTTPQNKRMGYTPEKAKAVYEAIEEKVKKALGARYIEEGKE